VVLKNLFHSLSNISYSAQIAFSFPDRDLAKTCQFFRDLQNPLILDHDGLRKRGVDGNVQMRLLGQRTSLERMRQVLKVLPTVAGGNDHRRQLSSRKALSSSGAHQSLLRKGMPNVLA
jgi:hypothetical protein